MRNFILGKATLLSLVVALFLSGCGGWLRHRDGGIVGRGGSMMPQMTLDNLQRRGDQKPAAVPTPGCPIADGTGTWEFFSDYGAGYVICHPSALGPIAEPFSETQDTSQAATPSTNADTDKIEIFPFPPSGFAGTVQAANVFISKTAGACHGGSGFEEVAKIAGVPFTVYDTTWAAAAKEGTGAVWSTTAGESCYSIGWFEWDFNAYADSSDAMSTGTDDLVNEDLHYVQHVRAIFAKMLSTFKIIEK